MRLRDVKICSRCDAERRPPTPLRAYLDAVGLSLAQLARDCVGRVSMRTIERAAAGEPIGERAAQRLARATGVNAAKLVAGTQR